MSSYVVTKRHLELLMNVPDDAKPLVLRHISGKKLERLTESAKDILIDTGLFELHDNRLVSLVRAAGIVDVAQAATEVAPKRKKRGRPAEELVTYFAKRYRNRLFTKYVVQKADITLMQRLLSSLTFNEVKAKINKYLADPASYFPHERGCATVKMFVFNINRITPEEVRTNEEPDEW